MSVENGRIMHIFIILFICIYFDSLAKLANSGFKIYFNPNGRTRHKGGNRNERLEKGK
jgi:hypothetical protein